MPSIDLVCEVTGLPPIQPETAAVDIAEKDARSGFLQLSGAPAAGAAQPGFAGPVLERRSISEQVANRIMGMIKSGNLKSATNFRPRRK